MYVQFSFYFILFHIDFFIYFFVTINFSNLLFFLIDLDLVF